jgi:hypothetical protein
MVSRIDGWVQVHLNQAARHPEGDPESLKWGERVVQVFRSLNDDDRAKTDAGKRLSAARIEEVAHENRIPADECHEIFQNFYNFFNRLPKGPIKIWTLAERDPNAPVRDLDAD